MAEQEAEKKPLWGNRTKVVIFGIFLILAFYGIANQDSDDPAVGNTDSGVSRGEAWNSCKEAVREQVRNPATADFSILSTTINERAGDGFNIDGSLTAENDFGVESNIAFSCDVDRSGSVTAEVAVG